MFTLKMDTSNTPNNSLLHHVKHEPNSMDMAKSEDILLGTIKLEILDTIKLEILDTKPACSTNSNQQISDVLSSVKTETEFSDRDHILNLNTVGDTKRWTVASSAVIPLVKEEHSIHVDPDHGVFESKPPEGTMQAPTLGTDLLSSSANGSDANKEDPLNLRTTKFVDIKECKYAAESVSNMNQDIGHPRHTQNTSNQGGFTSKGQLSYHQHVHTRGKPYKCTVCEKEFTHSSNLSRHKHIHTGEKPYKCSVCGKEFTQLGSLTRHQRIHTGEKPHKCSACGKDFLHSSALIDHMRRHTGEKPYKCSVCSKEFIRSCDLSRHHLTHTGKIPHKCSL